MHDPLQNDRLCDLVVRMFRSLLQYTNECWPWGGMEEVAEQKLIATLAARQQEEVQRLVDLLQERGESVEAGTYPTSYGELHYVALEYLMHNLLKDETALIAALEQEAAASTTDLSVAALLSDLIASERQTLLELQELAKRTPAALT